MSRIDGTARQLIKFIKERNYVLIAGTDEAGRGALAGPIVASAVVISPATRLRDVKDSKKLTHKQRESLYDVIREGCLCCASGIISAAEIDRIGIQAANIRAMEMAVTDLPVEPDCVLADWYENDSFKLPWHGVKAGEAAHVSIAAASIIAKVTRDRIMVELSGQYPLYGLDGHKGYGCEKHIEAINTHGPSPVHRLSFEPCASYQARKTAI